MSSQRTTQPGSISKYVDRAFRRSTKAELPVRGATITSNNRLAARISLQLDGTRVRELAYRASTCATLLAYCELLVEQAAEGALHTLSPFGAEDLTRLLPGVPTTHKDRAELAIAALQSALASA